jgi:hypothetical protein
MKRIVQLDYNDKFFPNGGPWRCDNCMRQVEWNDAEKRMMHTYGQTDVCDMPRGYADILGSDRCG